MFFIVKAVSQEREVFVTEALEENRMVLFSHDMMHACLMSAEDKQERDSFVKDIERLMNIRSVPLYGDEVFKCEAIDIKDIDMKGMGK